MPHLNAEPHKCFSPRNAVKEQRHQNWLLSHGHELGESPAADGGGHGQGQREVAPGNSQWHRDAPAARWEV